LAGPRPRISGRGLCDHSAGKPAGPDGLAAVEARNGGEQLSDSDVATILDLAQRLGLGPIEKILAGYVSSGNCRDVIVYERALPSPASTSVSRRTSASRWVGASCPLLNDESHQDVVVRDGWKTSPLARWRRGPSRTRVQFGDEHADFQLDDGVPAAVAEHIILAR
jgi:hypothetical protein